MTENSMQRFVPPVSDWHRVTSLKGGVQPASIHVYGNGFDMDQGKSWDVQQNKIMSYKRGKFADLNNLSASF
jgi:hypothetical protein